MNMPVGLIPKCTSALCNGMGVGSRHTGRQEEEVRSSVPSGELGSLVGKLHNLEVQKTSLAILQIFKYTTVGSGPNTDPTGLQSPISHLFPLLPSRPSKQGNRGPFCRFSPQGTRAEYSLQGRDFPQSATEVLYCRKAQILLNDQWDSRTK